VAPPKVALLCDIPSIPRLAHGSLRHPTHLPLATRFRFDIGASRRNLLRDCVSLGLWRWPDASVSFVELGGAALRSILGGGGVLSGVWVGGESEVGLLFTRTALGQRRGVKRRDGNERGFAAAVNREGLWVRSGRNR
jgi:hypothetical protein